MPNEIDEQLNGGSTASQIIHDEISAPDNFDYFAQQYHAVYGNSGGFRTPDSFCVISGNRSIRVEIGREVNQEDLRSPEVIRVLTELTSNNNTSISDWAYSQLDRATGLGVITPGVSPPSLVCGQCGDSVNVQQLRISRRRPLLCDECRQERAINCVSCSTLVDEFNVHRIEINGERVNYCNTCFHRDIINCSDCGCNTVRTDESTCQICQRAYCNDHRGGHRCNAYVRMPYRNYSHLKFEGNPERASMIKSSRLVGVELEAVGGNPLEVGNVLAREIGISDDGSLRGGNGIELQTPPASAHMLETFIDSASEALKNSNYKTNRSCGLHIHFDSSDFRTNGQKIMQVLETYYTIEPVLLKMLPKSRRNNRYALPITNWFSHLKMKDLKKSKRISLAKLETEWYRTDDYDQLRRYKNSKYDSSRYHGLNLHALLSNGHLELRYHHGTINKRKIKNWINFNINILEWALNKYSREKLEAIQRDKSIKRKAKKIVEYLELNNQTARYIRRQMMKFNRVDEDKD